MSEITVNLPGQAPKRRRWLRVLLWFVIGIILLVPILFLAVTSSAFVKSVILPRVSSAMHADVTVSEATIHLFREVELRDLKVQPKGLDPIVTAPEFRLRYSLWDIVHGDLHVDEIALMDPVVTVVQYPDGTSNLDPLTKQEEKPQPEKPKEPGKAGAGKPLKIELGKLLVSNATLCQEKRYAEGHRDIIDLTNLNLAIENVKNGDTGKLTLHLELGIDRNPPPPGAPGSLHAELDSGFTFAMTPDLKPSSVQGGSLLAVTDAAGALADAASLNFNLHCDATPTEIRQVSLRLLRSTETLGELLVHGPFDAQKSEGQLVVELNSIDKRLLNLVGAKSGIDFGTTTLNSSNQVEIAKAGNTISAAGRLDIGKAQLTRAEQTTPSLDINVAYDVELDPAAKLAHLRAFSLNGTGDGEPLLSGSLTSPMALTWGNASDAVGDSALDLIVTNLNLANWKAFLGDSVASGVVNVSTRVDSRRAGQDLSVLLESIASDLSVRAGSNQVSQLGMRATVQTGAVHFSQFHLDDCSVEITHRGHTVLTCSASGTCDTVSSNSEMQVAVIGLLPGLMQVVPQPGLTASSGTLNLNTHISRKGASQSITGNLALENFTGAIGQDRFQNYGSSIDLDLALTPAAAKINRIAGRLLANGTPGGTFDVAGAYDLHRHAADLKLALADINQNALRPFMEQALGGKRLDSIAVNGTANVQYDPANNSTVNAGISITNLVVTDPKGQFPDSPLATKLDVDTTLQKQSADIRQVLVTLTPTGRAKNEIQLQGHVDFSHADAIEGQLQLRSDSLDMTSYYDLFSGGKSQTQTNAGAGTTEGQARTTQPQSTASAQTQKEPDALKLPLRQFTIGAAIGKFYLHELEITNLQATLLLDGGHVLLKPLEMAINGGPLSCAADLDLGVPGFTYDVQLSADKVPLAPLVDSFQPDRAGQLGGKFTADAQVKGAGVTGANLQKNLNGRFNMISTNLSLSIGNLRSSLLKTLVNVIGTIPEILRNPTGALTTLFGGVSGKDGLATELSESPIDVITAKGNMGSGKLNLDQAVVRSSAFQANANGTVTIAEVLSNSPLNIPVIISLSRPISDRLNLTPIGLAKEVDYVALPSFVTLIGTVGRTKADIRGMALVGAAARSVGRTGGILQGVGGLLGGQGSNPSTPTTNSPPAQQQPANNLFNRLLK